MPIINDSSHLGKKTAEQQNKNHIKTNHSIKIPATSTDDLTFVFDIRKKALEWDICYP